MPSPTAPAVCHDTERSARSALTTTVLTKFICRVLRYVLAFVLCLTILAIFIPLEPLMPFSEPASGLLMSWMLTMNQAVARHLVFGKDIVFTFGPYASIYTGLYHPATDGLMIWGSLFLGLSYALLLLLIAKGEKFYWVLLYGIFLADLMTSRDALLFSYPLMMALVVYRMTLLDDHAIRLRLARRVEAGFPLLFASLGLLPLIKGSLLPICGITALLCSWLFWRRRKNALAYMAISIPAVSCVLLWAGAGQPIRALPGFFLGTWQIISGYTEGMAVRGDTSECVLYVLASAFILVAIVRTAQGSRSSRWFLFSSYTLFLFTAFKTGFVRHDQGHNLIAGTSVVAAALLLMFVLGERPSLAPLVMAALAWTYMNPRSIQTVAHDVSLNLRGTFDRAFQGTRKRLRETGELEKQYNEHLAAISRDFPIPRMPGTTDVYPHNQSWLLASQNTWAPRPVTESYSAYSPELAEMNLRHLQGTRAPDNILFRVEPIDSRFPSLEDGLSWPALINGYALLRLEGQSAYLQKRAIENKPVPPIETDLYSARHILGEEVSLPEAEGPLFARMEFTPTLLGRILGVLFKRPQLYVSVRLRHGTATQYRAISNMMSTDFLITPLVRNAEEFALLAAGGNKYLTHNEVKSITMSSEDRRGLFWNAVYSLRLRKLDLLKNTEAENSLLFDRLDAAVPANLSAPSTLMCEGSIEAVNGNPPATGSPAVGNALSVNGWMAVAAKEGIVPDSVFVSLRSESGRTFYVRAHGTRRDDLKRHFQQPRMPDPGYAAMIDVSALKGRYTLGLARIYKGSLGICQQFKLPLLINP